MKLKEKDDLSWCCVSRRHSSDNNSKDVNKQTRKMVPKHRSTEEVPLLVEKVKIIKKGKRKEKDRKHKKHLRWVSFFFIFIFFLFSLFALFDYDDSASYFCLFATYSFCPKGLNT
jgi:hypothetical protein